MQTWSGGSSGGGTNTGSGSSVISSKIFCNWDFNSAINYDILNYILSSILVKHARRVFSVLEFTLFMMLFLDVGGHGTGSGGSKCEFPLCMNGGSGGGVYTFCNIYKIL